MYTAYRTSIRESGTAYHIRTRTNGNKQGNRQKEKKKNSTGRKPYGFLKTRIPSLAPDMYVETDTDTKVNVTTKENFDFLYRSAVKYAQLMDMELPYHPERKTSIREKIGLLYDALDSILSHHINLELVEGRLQFCIYHFHEWPEYTLFWLPIDFTEKLNGGLKKITLEFIRRFIKHHCMLDITETLYYEMIEGYMDCIDTKDLDEEEMKEVQKQINLFYSYNKGKIHNRIRRMYSKAFCRNLEDHIRNYKPSNKQEKRLLELIGEGMSLISDNSPCIMDYEYDWDGERERDFEPPPLRTQILLAYSISDYVTDEMENCFNSECQETFNLTPVSYTFITPETENLFRPDDYPERFSKWFSGFCEHIIHKMNHHEQSDK